MAATKHSKAQPASVQATAQETGPGNRGTNRAAPRVTASKPSRGPTVPSGAAQGAKAGTPRAAAKARLSGPTAARATRGRNPAAARPAKARKLSGLDAAAQVLAAAGRPMTTTEVMTQIETKGLWVTKGATPKATIYAAIIREIASKGKAARFKKTGRGTFVATAA